MLNNFKKWVQTAVELIDEPNDLSKNIKQTSKENIHTTSNSLFYTENTINTNNNNGLFNIIKKQQQSEKKLNGNYLSPSYKPVILVSNENNTNSLMPKLNKQNILSKSLLELSPTADKSNLNADFDQRTISMSTSSSTALTNYHSTNQKTDNYSTNRYVKSPTVQSSPASRMPSNYEIKEEDANSRKCSDSSSVDLSHLSSEEKNQIESVLRRAQAEENALDNKLKSNELRESVDNSSSIKTGRSISVCIDRVQSGLKDDSASLNKTKSTNTFLHTNFNFAPNEPNKTQTSQEEIEMNYYNHETQRNHHTKRNSNNNILTSSPSSSISSLTSSSSCTNNPSNQSQTRAALCQSCQTRCLNQILANKCEKCLKEICNQCSILSSLSSNNLAVILCKPCSKQEVIDEARNSQIDKTDTLTTDNNSMLLSTSDNNHNLAKKKTNLKKQMNHIQIDDYNEVDDSIKISLSSDNNNVRIEALNNRRENYLEESDVVAIDYFDDHNNSNNNNDNFNDNDYQLQTKITKAAELNVINKNVIPTDTDKLSNESENNTATITTKAIFNTTSITINQSQSQPQKKTKRRLPSTPSVCETEMNSMQVTSALNAENTYSSNLSISNELSNTHLRLESDHKLNSFDVKTSPKLSDEMLNNSDNNNNSNNSSGSTLSVNSKPKLENVAEWLKKSFDQSQANQSQLLLASPNPACKSKSSHFLSTQKQHRSNSVTNHSATRRIVTDEPLIEINLNRNFYLKKQQKSQDELEEHRINNRSLFSLNNNNSLSLASNLVSNSYATFSKSHTPFFTNDNLEGDFYANDSDQIQKIMIYKDPKELSASTKSIDDMSNKSSLVSSRRPSASLGIQINGCQRLLDLDGNTLGAVVSAIEPDGIVDKFNVSIKEGDEIVQINGVNLRNKSDSQIDEIIDSTCQSNNGEIELLVRRSSTCSAKTDARRSSTPRSLDENNNLNHHQNNNNHNLIEPAKILLNNKQLINNYFSHIKNDQILKFNNNREEVAVTMNNDELNDSNDFRSITTPGSEFNESSFTSSPVTSDILINNGHNLNSTNNVNNDRQNFQSQSSVSSQSSSSSSTCSTTANNNQTTANKYEANKYTTIPEDVNLNELQMSLPDSQRVYNRRLGARLQRTNNSRFYENNTNNNNEGRGFSEISIKRKDNVAKSTRDTLMTDPASILANRSVNHNLNNPREIKPRSTLPKLANNNKVNDEKKEETNLQMPNFGESNNLTARSRSNSTRNLSPMSLNQFRAASPTNSISANDLTKLADEKNVNRSNYLDVKVSRANVRRIRSQEEENTTSGVGTDSATDAETTASRHLSSSLGYANNLGVNSAGSSNNSSRRNSKDETDSLFSYTSSIKMNEASKVRAKNEEKNAATMTTTTTTTTRTFLVLPDGSLGHSSADESQGTPAQQQSTSNSHSPKKSRLLFRLSKKSDSDSLEQQKSFEQKNYYGEIQVQISHNEEEQHIVVKILRAKNLIAKDANGFSDPFVKIYLLPGRDVDNKRRTKHVAKSLNPEWNHTVVYPNVHKEEVKYKTLELTLWDYDRFKSNDFLGMVRIDLSDPAFLDHKPRWFLLKDNHEFDTSNDRLSEAQKPNTNNKSFKKSKNHAKNNN